LQKFEKRVPAPEPMLIILLFDVHPARMNVK